MSDNRKGQDPFAEKIENVTRNLLDDWEVSEDDFEDTQDLAEAAARIAEEEARRAAVYKAAEDRGNIREDRENRESGRRNEGERRNARGLSDDRTESRRHSYEADRREEGRQDRRAEERADRRGDGRTDSRADARADRRSDDRPDRRADARADRRSAGRPDRRAEDRADRRSDSRPDRRSDARAYRAEADIRRNARETARPGANRRTRKQNPVAEFWNSLQTMDKVIGFTGIAVCLFAVLTFSVVLNAKGVNRQVEAFAEIGENMAGIQVADQGVFLAVADGYMARQQAADLTEEEEEYNETDDTSDVQVGLNMTSVEKDLKIKFVNRKTGKLIPYVNFQVEVKGPDKTYNKEDDDKDGIIYLTGITGGEYTVRITGPENPEGYVLPTDAQSVTVKKTIEYKKIDVKDEIKSESEVNASKEDTEIKAPVESVLQDTVEWVESTKTPVNGDSGSAYTEVKKADVPDPGATARADFALFAGIKGVGTQTQGTEVQGTDGLSRTAAPQTNTTEPSVPESSTPESSTAPSESPTQPESSAPDPTTPSSSTPDPTTPSTSTPEPTPPESSETSDPKPEEIPVTGISISPSEQNATAGDEFRLAVTITPGDASDQTVSWASDNAGVASVDGSGKVTCIAAGTATITAATKNGKTASARITVAAKPVAVTGVSLSGDAQVAVGGTITLTAKVEPSNATYDKISWSTSDSGVATVDGGKVKGVKAGTVTIKATVGGKEASKTITVVSNESSSLTVKDTTIEAGKTAKADFSAGNVSSLTFSIENTKYATIDGNGNIRAIRAGETKYTVKVKYKDGKEETKTAKLTVKAAEVKKITLDKTSVTLKVGETLKLNPTIETSGYTGCLWYTSDASIVSVEEHGGGTIKALKPGKVKITAKSSEDTSKQAVCEVTVTGKDVKDDTTTPLKDKNGKQLYIKNSEGKYVAAVAADYYKYDVFYRLNENVEYKYTGWQTIDGKRYYFDKNGNKVTGDQVIQGVQYSFGSDGALSSGSGVLGIDVSKHNGSINWAEVKNSGVSFVIIRCGYRGSSTGAMIEDPKFKSNIQGAAAAGLKVGVYFFSQAVNRVEAVEEASMTLELIKNYKISYPVFLDVEAAGGRADGIDSGTRTEVIQAYCETIRNGGYTPGLYANKTWLNSKINTGSLGSTKIWLAQYAAAPTYNGRYEMWQYSSTGRIGGISGNVDLNISYLGY